MKGTSYDQDARFADKTKLMLQNSQWPDKYDNKIDLTKVDITLIKVWIQKRIFRLLGQQDDIVTGTINSLLDSYIENGDKPNAKKMHVDLSGFLRQKTLTFMSELWDLLDDAQKSLKGIPESLIEQKRKQLAEQQKRLDEIKKKKQNYQHKKFGQTILRNIDRKEQSQRKCYNRENYQRPYLIKEYYRRDVDQRQKREQRQISERRYERRSRSRDSRHKKKQKFKQSKRYRRSPVRRKSDRSQSYSSSSEVYKKRKISRSLSSSAKAKQTKKSKISQPSSISKYRVSKQIKSHKKQSHEQRKRRQELSSSSAESSSSQSSSVISSSNSSQKSKSISMSM